MSLSDQELGENWISDLRNWVEWQALCGATDLACLSLSDLFLEISASQENEGENQRRRVDLRSPKTPSRVTTQPPPVKKRPKEVGSASTINPTSTPPRQAKPLGGLWGSVLKTKPLAFNPDSVQTGKSGLMACQQHWQKHCSEGKCHIKKHIPWGFIGGRGAPDAPVVLIEGHDDRLGPDGLKMLSNMRENVMGIPKSQLFWLPVYKAGDCGLQDIMAQGQFNALQPKAVLIMGQRPLDLFKVEGERVELGATLSMKTLSGSVPAICTHHPNALLKKPALKKNAFVHLQAFKRLLKRIDVI